MLLDKLQEPHRSALARVRRSVALRTRRGWRASLLGGAVRDLVIGRQPHDLDFVLEGVESKDALHVWATLLADGVLDDAARVIVTGFDGLRFEVDGVGVDAWRVEDNAIGAGRGRHHETIGSVLAGGVTLTTDACAVVLGATPADDVECTAHLLHALERGEVGIVSSSRLMPTIVLARAAKACVDLGLRPGPSLVEFVAANLVGDMSFGVALRRHRAGMTPTQAREVLGMPPAQTRPRKSVT